MCVSLCHPQGFWGKSSLYMELMGYNNSIIYYTVEPQQYSNHRDDSSNRSGGARVARSHSLCLKGH